MMHKFLLFFLYSSLVTFLSVTHSFAKEDEWQIDDFDSFIVASVPGEVVHGDKLRFALKKESCDKLNILFSFLTYKNPKEIKRLEGMTIPIKINPMAYYVALCAISSGVLVLSKTLVSLPSTMAKNG